MASYCTYIMGSLSGTLYVGMTGNLHKRVFEHKFHCIQGFTKKHEIDRLLYWESFHDPCDAIDREKQLKGWRRSKKIGLFQKTNPHWVDLAKDWYPWMKDRKEGRGASTPPKDSPAAPPSSPLSMTKN
jgi:putative endonuclease